MTASDPGLAWVADAEAGRTLRPASLRGSAESALACPLCEEIAAGSVRPAVCCVWAADFAKPSRFPTAEVLAAQTPARLAKRLKLTPQVAKAMHALSCFCADGRFYPESSGACRATLLPC